PAARGRGDERVQDPGGRRLPALGLPDVAPRRQRAEADPHQEVASRADATPARAMPARAGAAEALDRSVSLTLDRTGITAARDIIRPYIRLTPVVEVNGADLGIAALPLTLKLEQLQHSGSFKARGAFANLLTRSIPAAGVVAASGGNHGAAVAFAAMRLGVPAKIFVPTVSSPAKIRRIRDYGADLVVGGERYTDALAASVAWAAQSGAL